MKRIFALILTFVLIMSLCPLSFAESGYSVLVTDEEGEPVANVKVQLCTDSTCFVEATGEDGIAEFDVESGEYEVHILKVPEGFTKNRDAQFTSADGCQITFVLKKEAANKSMSEKTLRYPEPEQTYNSLNDINFGDYELILVNYWEPWCGWCKDEMPDFEKLYQKYKEDGLLIVGVYSEDPEDAPGVIDELGITYPTMYIPEKCEYNSSGVPKTLFYDSDGSILPPTEDECVNERMAGIRFDIDDYLAGKFDEYTDEESMEYKSDLDKIIAGEIDLYGYALESVREYGDTETDTFDGCADYDAWNKRIRNRLGY